MEEKIYESLKKLKYDNLQQFVEDINRNFALIQNSPLYKGLPGDAGNPGDKGDTGTRGSNFFFVTFDKMNEAFPKELTGSDSITIDWLNAKLQGFETKNTLFDAFKVKSFVHNDILVMPDSLMIQYDIFSDTFVSTGIYFNEKDNLISSIETKINEYVKHYVDNHPAILNIQNVFEHFVTYAKNYTSTSNAFITNKETQSSIYVPYIAGISDTQGVQLDNHKYFGFADIEFPVANNGTLVIGSMKLYTQMLLDTISITRANTYTSDYAPGANNIPSLILMQDSVNNGLMFGRKQSANLRRFASIYKDADDNLIIKSDQGNLATDYSAIKINRNYMQYDKPVYFGDNLEIDKDFINHGNHDSKIIRNSEFIHDASKYGPLSLSEGSQDQLTAAANQRMKIMEVGYWERGSNQTETEVGKNCEYRNLNEILKFKWFPNNILATDETGTLLKSYSFETNYDFNESDGLIKWNGTADTKFHIPTSEHIRRLVLSINKLQQNIIDNYWRKDQFARVTGNNADIPSLYLREDLNVNRYFSVGNGNPGINSNNASIIVNNSNDLILGKYLNNSTVILRSNTLNLPRYNTADIVLTTDSSGNVLKTFTRFTVPVPKDSDSLADIAKLDSKDYDKKYLTANYWLWLVKRANQEIQNTNTSLNDDYWKKSEYWPTTGDAKAIIPALKLKTFLMCNSIVTPTFSNFENTTIIGKEKVNHLVSIFGNLQLSNIKVTETNKAKILSLDSSELVESIFDNCNVELPAIQDIENITLPTIQNPTTQLLNYTHMLWLNNRINNVLGSDGEGDGGLLNLYWKKTQYTGFIIPNLELSGNLHARGSFSVGTENNPNIRTTAGGLTEIGTSGTNSKLELQSEDVKFENKDFASKVLVTDINGSIRKDITMCTDKSETENSDNTVPTSTTDAVNYNNKADVTKTNDFKKILTGQQFKWIQSFMNFVKKRFINTFNRKETIDQLYDHMPVGSIIIWTKASALAAGIDGQIPRGWAVCDGSKLPNSNINTPNLTNLFLRGVNTLANSGVRGGSNSHLIDKTELPNLKHKHDFRTEQQYNGKHTHNYSISVDTTKRLYPQFTGTNSPKPTGNLPLDRVYARLAWIPTSHTGNIYPRNDEGDKSNDNEFFKTDFGGFTKLTDVFSILKLGNDSNGGTHQHMLKEWQLNSDSHKQVEIATVPEYYTVIYIMKYDTRVSGSDGYYNPKYTLVDTDTISETEDDDYVED